jgi:hypothetical protein
MIPALIPLPGSPWDILPPGVHVATMAEVESAFAHNQHRRNLYRGLIDASLTLANAGCRCTDGSYVTAKPFPRDYDACWEPTGVDFDELDPIFADFDNERANQKARFKGEFFPATMITLDTGAAFAEFFQIDRFTGRRKGILSISIDVDPIVVARRMKA